MPQIDFTESEIKILNLAMINLEKAYTSYGGSRDYDFEDSCKAIENKLRKQLES